MTVLQRAQETYVDTGSSALGLQIAISVAAIAILGLSIWGLVDALVRPTAAWRSAGRSKVFWVVVQILLAPLASIAYLLVVRRELRAAGAPPS
jgi:hypothetical protein